MTPTARSLKTMLFLLTCAASMGAAADKCMPSPWGADDQIGAANRITTERIATAAQLVKKGESKIYSSKGESLHILVLGSSSS